MGVVSFTPGTHPIGDCVGVRTDLDAVEKREFSNHRRELHRPNPDRPARSRSLYRLSYRGS